MSPYKIRYLSTFIEDARRISYYISYILNEPVAARNLLDDVEKAIEQRADYPKSFEKARLKRRRKLPYYVIRVRNYRIYYVVIDHEIMEIRRLLHKNQDSDKQLQ